MRQEQKGFTIVELMIASAVFATVLAIASVAVLNISRAYYSGLTQTRNQEVARAVMDELAQSLQLARTVQGLPFSTKLDSNDGSFCIGNKQYRANLGAYQDDDRDATNPPVGFAVRELSGGATCATTDTVGGGALPIPTVTDGVSEFIGQGMRLADLDISGNPASGVYDITVVVVTGQDDLLTDPPNDYSCRGDRSGGQFCAYATLTTTVQGRLQ